MRNMSMLQRARTVLSTGRVNYRQFCNLAKPSLAYVLKVGLLLPARAAIASLSLCSPDSISGSIALQA